MKICIDLQKYFNDYVSKIVWGKTSALAQVMPDILSDYFPQLSVLYLENRNLVCLEDFQGRRWKVWCSRNNIFDISPSLTKGFGRSKEGVDILSSAKTSYYGCIFLKLKDVNNVSVWFKDWKSLEVDDKGKVHLDE